MVNKGMVRGVDRGERPGKLSIPYSRLHIFQIFHIVVVVVSGGDNGCGKNSMVVLVVVVVVVSGGDSGCGRGSRVVAIVGVIGLVG